MGALLAILGAVGNIALYLGAQWIWEKVENIKAQKEGLTQDQLTAKLQALLNEVQSRDARMYSRLSEKISSMPDGDRIVSSQVRNDLRRRRRSYSTKMEDVEKSMRDTDILSSRVANYAAQTPSYKLSKVGEEDFKSIESAVEAKLKSE